MSALNRKSGLIGFALLCASAVTGAALAQTPAPTVKNVKVNYTRFDAEQPDQAAKLYSRIRFAAREACGEPDVRQLYLLKGYQSCYEQAVELAVAKVNAPALTAIHQRVQHGATG